ncbi:MAG: hypothetical protein ABI886_17800 [Betaproteobacteria bacterium]
MSSATALVVRSSSNWLHVIGVGVPLFGCERAVLGSLSIVFSEDRFPQRRSDRIIAQLRQAVEAVHDGLARYAASPQPGTAARKPRRPRSVKAKRG